MREPLLLALETATSTVSVALCRGERPLAEALADPDRPASEVLLPTLDAVLAEAGVRLGDVEAFAVSIGPGSFTGLRIGVATLKGLAFGSGRPAVAVPTLAALAALASDGPAVGVLDARRGEVYAAGFDAAGRPADWLPEGVYAAGELARRVPAGARMVGEGVAVCRGPVEEAAAGALRWVPPPEGRARAGRVAVLAARAVAAGEAGDAAALVPRYVRRAEAEARRTGERFEA